MIVKRQVKEYHLLVFRSFDELSKILAKFASEGWVVVADMTSVPMYDKSIQNALLLERDFDESKNQAEAAIATAAVANTKAKSLAERQAEAEAEAKAVLEKLNAVKAEAEAAEADRQKAEAAAAEAAKLAQTPIQTEPEA